MGVANINRIERLVSSSDLTSRNNLVALLHRVPGRKELIRLPVTRADRERLISLYESIMNASINLGDGILELECLDRLEVLRSLTLPEQRRMVTLGRNASPPSPAWLRTSAFIAAIDADAVLAGEVRSKFRSAVQLDQQDRLKIAGVLKAVGIGALQPSSARQSRR